MTKVARRQQRDELKRLSHVANAPDKSSEPLSQNSAPAFMVKKHIDELILHYPVVLSAAPEQLAL